MPEVTCYQCNIKIPADKDNPICPFCKKPVGFSPEEVQQDDDIRKILVPQESFSSVKEFYRQYGTWLKLGLLALFVVSAIWVGMLLMMGVSIEIPKDPVFPIKVEKVRDGLQIVLLKGTVTNLGEDIHGISLRSLGVTVEFRWSNGRVEKKRIYPKSAYRGDGSLFYGESGVFEIEVPPKIESVTLWAEVVDLGEDRNFRLPGSKRNPPSKKTK